MLSPPQQVDAPSLLAVVTGSSIIATTELRVNRQVSTLMHPCALQVLLEA